MDTKGSEETSPLLLPGAQHQRLGAEQDQPSCGAHGSLYWQLSRDGNSQGSGMSRTTTASLKSSFTAPSMVGDAVVDRRNAEWTTPKSGRPCPCQDC